MPSLAHNFILWVFRKGLIPNPMQIALDRGFVFRKPPDDKHVRKFGVKTEHFREYPVYTYGEPRNGAPILYYCHGGGFVAGMFKSYFDAIAPLHRALGHPVIVPDYPMPEETDAASMRNWVVGHFNSIREAYPEAPIIVAGDSAGANMALKLVQDLKTDAAAAIKSVFLLFGWFDLSRLEVDFPDNKEEVLLKADGIVQAADRFRGELPATDPMISPIFGPLDGLPPIHIVSGDKDILFADSQKLEAQLGSSEPSCTHQIYADYSHDFWLLPSPDGRRALKEIAQNINAAFKS